MQSESSPQLQQQPFVAEAESQLAVGVSTDVIGRTIVVIADVTLHSARLLQLLRPSVRPSMGHN